MRVLRWAAKERELRTWGESEVFQPAKENALSKSLGKTRWVLTEEDAEARLVAKARQDLNLKDDLAETSG